MTMTSSIPMHRPPPDRAAVRRSAIIGLIGFLTLTDLFATQAILPSLAAQFHVAPGQIGVAANAGTIGMAIAGLLAGVLAGALDRRAVITASLAVLAVPTALLAIAPDLTLFALLRVAQGLCMATAFTLTIAYIAEHCSPGETATALSAYVTGVVASNLIGRLIATTVVSLAGTEANFVVFAALNLAGAALTWTALSRGAPMMPMTTAPRRFWSAWGVHLADARLRRCFAIGFLILFGFIGVFTYIGFVLTASPIGVSMGRLGLVFLCFAPSMVTTPLAGHAAERFGANRAVAASLLLSAVALLALLSTNLWLIVAGLTVFAAGTFFAQAIATGFVGRAATVERAAASGLYLAFYYAGGLVGASVIGQLFDAFGWPMAVAAVATALVVAAVLGLGLHPRDQGSPSSSRR